MSRPGIRPVVWNPPVPPPRARARSSTPPMPAPALMPIDAEGPEDVAVEHDGAVLTGTADGRILRLRPETGDIDVLADTGGGPLGIEVDPQGGIVVCDAVRGLLHVDAGGSVRTLVAADEQMLVCNNSAVAADGTIYFTDSSRRFALEHWKADLIEHTGTGRLLRRSPSGEVEVLLDGLQFANGVALSGDGSFVAVAETGGYRLRRVWLEGPRAGTNDVLISNLPGLPDNISTGADGRIWIALPSPRNRLLDWSHSKPPWLRRAIWGMPNRFQPAPARTAWVMAVDAAGDIVGDLHGPGDRYHMVTGVREHAGRLYLGSLTEKAIAWLELPAAE